MKGSKKLLAILLALLLVMSAFFSTASLTVSAAAAQEIPEGASLSLVKDLGVTGSEVYLYVPSVLYSPPPMMTPVIYVYGDKRYADLEQAWSAMKATGLAELAEAERALIFMVNPVEETWGAQDVDVYTAMWKYIYFPISGSGQRYQASYLNLMYLMGEGSGATFINQYMTQNASRIAGVLTFGGQMPAAVSPSVPLPAYIAGGTSEAIAYYKTVNGTDMETVADNGIITYSNSQHTVKKVIANPSPSAVRFEKVIIQDAWQSLLRRTTRGTLGAPIWMNQNTTEVFTLMERPMVDELGLQFREILGSTVIPGLTRWYEWIPSEVYKSMSSGSQLKYPLVISLHGSGDHPVFESESNGWVAMAGKERFILVSLDEHQNPDVNQQFIDYIKTQYPIDASRIYITGFSLGGMSTLSTCAKYLDTFAAMVPMAAPSFQQFSYDPEVVDTLDIPFCFVTGSADMFCSSQGHSTSQALISKALVLNNIEPYSGTPDYTAYPFWGVPVQRNSAYKTQDDVTMDVSSFDNSEGVEMVRLIHADHAFNFNHNHYTGFASAAWDYMKHFSRNPNTKQVTYNTNAERTDPFLATLRKDGYAEVGRYAVTQLKANLYHIDEWTQKNPLFGASSMYVFVDGGEALLVDAGNPSGANKQNITDILYALTNGKQLQVILTHGHGDHTGILRENVVPLENLKAVYCPEKDYVASGVVSAKTALAYYAQADKLTLVKGGDTLTVGAYKFDIYDFNGHTDGSIGLVQPNLEMAFTGDSMGSGFVWMLFNDVPEALKRYDDGLKALSAVTQNMTNIRFYPGHRWQQVLWPTTDDGEIGWAYVDNMIRILAAIRDASATFAPYNSGRGQKEWAVTAPSAGKAAIDVSQYVLDQYFQQYGTLKPTASGPESALMNETFTLTATIGRQYVGVKLMNENGNLVTLSSATKVEGPLSNTWTISTKVGSLGKRVLKVLGVKADGTYEDAGIDYKIAIDKNEQAPKVLSVTPPSGVKVNVAANYTIVANAEGFYSANLRAKGASSDLGKTVVSKTQNADGTYTYVLSVKIGTAGKRELEAFAGNASGVRSEPYPFPLTVSLI